MQISNTNKKYFKRNMIIISLKFGKIMRGVFEIEKCVEKSLLN